jgi:hypothetical protein
MWMANARSKKNAPGLGNRFDPTGDSTLMPPDKYTSSSLLWVKSLSEFIRQNDNARRRF